jgi:hypothetical protein
MNLVMESIILRPIASRGQRSPGAKPTGPSEFREDSSLELLSFQLREFYGRVLMPRSQERCSVRIYSIDIMTEARAERRGQEFESEAAFKSLDVPFVNLPLFISPISVERRRDDFNWQGPP